MASLFHYLWVESPHRDRQQSAKSWGCGGKAPALGHSPALFHQTAGAFSFSIALQQDGTTPAPRIASAFRSGAHFYNALIFRTATGSVPFPTPATFKLNRWASRGGMSIRGGIAV
jgi:hypothetical protein